MEAVYLSKLKVFDFSESENDIYFRTEGVQVMSGQLYEFSPTFLGALAAKL
jgi:hypothetical protein